VRSTPLYGEQNLPSAGSVGSRPDVEVMVVLITGGPSSDMRRTLDEATSARQAGLRLIVVGVGTWVNKVELAGVASYPYHATRVLLPDGFGVLPSIHTWLRDIICNSTHSSILHFIESIYDSIRYATFLVSSKVDTTIVIIVIIDILKWPRQLKLLQEPSVVIFIYCIVP